MSACSADKPEGSALSSPFSGGVDFMLGSGRSFCLHRAKSAGFTRPRASQLFIRSLPKWCGAISDATGQVRASSIRPPSVASLKNPACPSAGPGFFSLGTIGVFPANSLRPVSDRPRRDARGLRAGTLRGLR